jgi:hypothetical protein
MVVFCMIVSMLLDVYAYGDLTTTVLRDILCYRHRDIALGSYRAEMRYRDQSIQLDLTYLSDTLQLRLR